MKDKTNKQRNNKHKKNEIFAIYGVLVILIFGIGIGITSGMAQAPPDNPGKPENPGGQDNAGNQQNNLVEFKETQPVGNVDPSNLSGKIRVESQYEENTSVKLVRNSSTNYTIDITITENATNVSFYLQRQAVASSQNISNVTMKLDGQNHTFVVKNAGPGNSPWIGFKIPEFSTRTVSFTSLDSNVSAVDQYDIDGDGQISGSEVRQAISCFLFNTSCVDVELTGNQVRQVISEFLFPT